MLRNRLKTLTAPLHDELEFDSILKKAIDKTISKDEYTRALFCFYKTLKPIEENIFKYCDKFGFYGLDILKRAKLHLLENDLNSLGCGLPHVEDTAELAFEEVVGAMYVFEGSTMGGLRLNAQLDGVSFAKDAHTYFLPYGNGAMAMWQEFCGFLDKLSENNDFDADRCILSACGIFLDIGRGVRL